MKQPDQAPVTDPPIEVRTVLQGCYELEVIASKIYTQLALAHKDSPSIAELWRKTAAEEDNHAEQIALAMRVHKGLVVGTLTDRTKLSEILTHARSVLQKVTASPPSVVEGLRLAIDLEGRFHKFHLDEVAVFSDPGQRSLFRAMQAADNAHVGMLQAALAKYTKK